MADLENLKSRSAEELKIGIIGVGKMGGAIARVLQEDFKIMLYDKVGVPDDLKSYESTPDEIVQKAQIIIIAVKPKDIYDVLSDISKSLSTSLIVSLAAGITSDFLRRFVRRWARVMPSITVSEKEGVFAVFASTEEDALLLEKIFKRYGKVFIVNSDEEIDIFTATSASGPGYLSVVFEAFEDALVRAGLSRKIAREVSAQTFLGIAKLILAGKSPSQIKDEVMTPAGTTAEGLVEISDIRKYIFRAVQSSLEKCKEISQKLKGK